MTNIISQTRYAYGGARITLQIESETPLHPSVYSSIAAAASAVDELAVHLSQLADPIAEIRKADTTVTP